jgi:LysM repeat protein
MKNTRDTHRWRGARLSPGGAFGLIVIALALTGMLAGCGQVITVTPTPTPEPTPTVDVAGVASTVEPTPTPAPYTPAPTPTPTVTPTPVFHTVAGGESLLSIATRYGVSVSALQDANGILDPRLLQVGQQLIIPSPEEGAANDAFATPTPTPLPMLVENLHFGETVMGGLWVLGEVYNSSEVPLEQVRVGVTLSDEEQNELAQAQTLVALDLVDVHERAPFAVLFDHAPERFDQYQVAVISAVPAYVGSYYRDLAVEDLEIVGERYASYTVSGVIRNIGPEEAVSVQVVLTAYDPMDRVVAMRAVDPDHNVVARGGETTFTAILAPVGGPVTRVEAAAQGRRLQAAGN